MGVKNWIAKRGQKAGDKIAKLSTLSPGQIEEIQKQRDQYYTLLENADPASAVYLTESLIAASSVEIYNAYLPQLSELYDPVERSFGLNGEFRTRNNIRYMNITKWVTDKEENSIEKLVNVYEVLSGEDCNISLIFRRTCNQTEVYLAVTNNLNDQSNGRVDDYYKRLSDAVRGNFPGSEWSKKAMSGTPEFLDNDIRYSVASCSNVPTEKSEKFISQTIEKLLDGIIPDSYEKEYTIILLATPIQDIEERKLRLSELYSGLAPYASWQTNFTYTETNGVSSSAQLGVNVGASAGVQNGQNQSFTQSQSQADSKSHSDANAQGKSEAEAQGNTETKNEGITNTESDNYTKNESLSEIDTQNTSQTIGTQNSKSFQQSNSTNTTETDGTNVGLNAGISLGEGIKADLGGSLSESHSEAFAKGFSETIGNSTSTTNNITEGLSKAKGIIKGSSETKGKALAKTYGKAVAKSVTNTVNKSASKTVTDTIGRTITNTLGRTAGTFKSVNLGTNFGVNFARASNVTASVGKNEGITQSFTNFNIKHALELLEEQMKRYEQSTALGMWDFAAYVLSEDLNTANNVAHTYLALTQGEESYMSRASVNLWRGDTSDSSAAEEICGYLRELRHPLFGLDLVVTENEPDYNVYPPLVTATTALSGKELAFSLNFPRRSLAGFPVIECAEFGRSVNSYYNACDDVSLHIGNVFHMNHEEATPVELSADSLASHTFITGSTGTGKSNTIYRLLTEAQEIGIRFLVIEPAKGEYRHVFGNNQDVSVYSTNPAVSPLLRIDPFSFPDGIHVLEHTDRLVEIFNVCWPMYAAMPAVLKNAVEKSYADCGWDLKRSVNRYGKKLYPVFADIARNVKAIIDSSEYDSENKGAYKGSLLTRLNSLTNGINGMLFTSDELTGKQLFDENVIIDLSRVGSGETKSLIMGMLVLKLQEYRMTGSEMNAQLKHITVLEEAHNLLKRVSTEQTTESGNLLGKSVEMISNAIAEMRTYGEGFIIADQAPGLLDMSVIRNTNTKMILRLPDQSDRELVGRAANLNDAQIAELAKLPRGVAAVYQNEWVQPVLCKVDKADVSGSVYSYEPEEDSAPDMHEGLRIAEFLSSGTRLDREVILCDIADSLERINIIPSVRVKILDMLLEPSSSPRMTKLAPVISALFPDIHMAFEKVYTETKDPAVWTECAEVELRRISDGHIDDQVRRDIIQAIVTDYIYNQLGKPDELRKWQLEGGLK